MSNLSDMPDDSSIQVFRTRLANHDKVQSIGPMSDFSFKIILKTGQALLVVVTNVYCIGEADVHETLIDNPDFDALVTLSSWNHVSAEASKYGISLKKGIFRFGQFFGSLNYRKFWLYEEMDQTLDGQARSKESARRRRAWN